MTKTKVSIVLPIYNAERYLKECMESVKNQTLEDIEIICVDDGSIDNSPCILDSYAREDKRIKVIHKKNSGYGSSVNIGIKQAVGEYIGIVEPDDYIELDMMEVLYGYASKCQLDIISSDYKWFTDEKEKRVFTNHKIYEDESLYEKVFCVCEDKRFIHGNFINPASLFRREFLNKNQIYHNETPGAAFQDRGFCYLSILNAKRIMVIKNQFYCYRHDNPNSSIANPNNIMVVINEYQLIQKNIREKYPCFEKYIPDILCREYGSCRYALARSIPKLWWDCIDKISKEFKVYYEKNQLQFESFPVEWRDELIEIIENPVGFYNKFASLRDEVHEKVSSCEKFVIYGAGVIGKRIYDGLYDEDKEKLMGFCVSSLDNNMTCYKEAKIASIDEYKFMKEELAILVGVSQKNRESILQVLKDQGFKKILLLEAVSANI